MSNPTDTPAPVLAELAVLRQRVTELEAAHTTSEQRFRALIENSADGMSLLDSQGVVVYTSPPITRILGFTPEEYTGQNALTLLHPDDFSHCAELFAQLFQHPGHPLTSQFRYRHKDGSWRWLEAVGVNLLTEPAIAGIVINFRDISRRKQAEEALREGEERYRIISEMVSDQAFSFRIEADGTATLEWMVGHFTQLTGYTLEEMNPLGSWNSLIYPEDWPIAYQRRERLKAGQPDVSEYRIRAKDGRVLWMRFFGRPVWNETLGRISHIYGAAQDITKLKELEQQLSQAQKMEAIGQLAGGVAHDFNNILTIIVGNCSLIMSSLSPNEPIYHDLEQTYKAANRAATLTRQLLAFSRQQILQPQIININEVVATIQPMLHRLIGEDIELVPRFEPELGQVRADPRQIEQMILNLAINAGDAMPNGGRLFIKTANVYLDRAYAQHRVNVTPGPYILLEITDTGLGMDATTRAHIFEPFFTTKEQGRGTGLGLAMVHGIVNQSGGHILVNSEPDQGSTFKIYLPRAAQTAGPVELAKETASLSPGSGTILLVADEETVRLLTNKVLQKCGYEVLEVSSAQDALLRAKQHPEPIDLLLTDVILPGGLNGHQLAEQLLVQRPDMKVLYISSYTNNVLEHQGELNWDSAFLQKPFTPDALAYTVWKILH